MKIRHDEAMVVNGRLKQIGMSFKIKMGTQRVSHAVFECKCGNKLLMIVGNVKSNKSKSCGCLNDAVRGQCLVKHGQNRSKKRTAEYRTWCNIKDRCHRETSNCYGRYGAKGIKVCEQWFNSFEAFFEYMGPRPDGCSIDRIDNSKGYEPGNCRWATWTEQQRNKTSNVLMTIDGVTKCRGEWATVENAADYFVIRARKKRGWSDKEAVFGRNQ
jgi:hypothetical protein